MLDETIVTETAPLYNCYGPISDNCGSRSARSTPSTCSYRAINILSGDLALLITEDWIQDAHEAFLQTIRAHWRGWNLVVFDDRASQHKAARVWT